MSTAGLPRPQINYPLPDRRGALHRLQALRGGARTQPALFGVTPPDGVSKSTPGLSCLLLLLIHKGRRRQVEVHGPRCIPLCTFFYIPK